MSAPRCSPARNRAILCAFYFTQVRFRGVGKVMSFCQVAPRAIRSKTQLLRSSSRKVGQNHCANSESLRRSIAKQSLAFLSQKPTDDRDILIALLQD
jgi:hypothetical protein